MFYNLAKAFEETANGKPILGAVLGQHYSDRYDEPKPAWVGKLISWEKAKKILNYDYDNGYGGADCHPAYVWTEDKVMFVSEYDGATAVSFVPRNPIEFEPTFSGS
jgi:hypothetical protein